MKDSPIILFENRSRQPCIDCQLVLRARGINSEIISTDDGFSLVVDEGDEHMAAREITAYIRENSIHEPGLTIREPLPLNTGPGLIGYVAVLSIVSTVAGFDLLGLNWYAQGRIDSSLIYQGQWWRLATALTLHGDGSHLISNVGFGLLFLYFVGRYLGYGLAGLAMLASGIIGNGINVYMHGSNHYSIGASTAVFGMLGLLSLYTWKRRYFSQASWSKRLGPIFGGIALLAFTGTHGERTDIGAHLWGFIAGGAVGYLFARFHEYIALNVQAQKRYGLVSLLWVVLSWLMALI